MTQRSILRVLDANANRALEGIRVCEDIIRFHLESAHAFRRTRALRHAIADALAQLPISPAELVLARNSHHDVGRHATSSRIPSLEQLLLINFQRAKEALRVLEECTRLIAPRRTASFQRLRFRTYEVERDLLRGLATLRHR